MAGSTPTPTPTARSLGGELRAVREAAKISQRELARRIEVDQSVLSRWESGARRPAPEDVERFLAELGVSIEDRERILATARQPDGGTWLSTGMPQQGEQLTALLGFESTAVRIVEVGGGLLPGLMQTGDYARAVTAGGRVPADEIPTRVAVRLGRREVLEREHPVELLAFIPEAALRSNIGGRRVMLGQLRHLLAMAALPHVEIRIVPTDCGYHDGLLGSFSFYTFAGATPIVYVETGPSGLFFSEEAVIEERQRNMASVAAVALSPELSIEMIAGEIDRMENECST